MLYAVMFKDGKVEIVKKNFLRSFIKTHKKDVFGYKKVYSQTA